ncbi:MAG: tetratricopeptide repeat protein [Planctomycetota bacterium]
MKTISLLGFTPDEIKDFILRKYGERELLATARENHLKEEDICPEGGLITTIHEKSRGNPLFIEQVLKLLDEKGCLVQQQSVLRMVKDVDYTELSKELKLYDIIDTRVEHMKEEKHYDLHKYASVIGERFSSHALSALESELETKSVADSLKSAADTYRLIQHIDDLLFQFSHTLIREVFYDRLRAENLDPSPAELHARVAQWLKKEYGENPERDQIISLADHFAKGKVFDEAMYYLGLAAEQSRTDRAYHELQKVLERMVSLLETNRIGTQKEWYDVLFRLGETYEILGDKSKAVNALRRAVEIATEIDDSMKKAAAMVRFGVSLFHSGDYQKSIKELECAREIYEVEETAGTLSTEQCASYGICLDYIGENYRELGELKEAERFHNKVIQLVGQSEDNKLKSVAAHAYAQLGAIQLRQPNYQETLKYWNRALEISEQITDKPWMAHFAIDVGFVYLLTEKYDCAIEYLTRGVSHAVEGYFEDNIARGLMNRASVYFVEGKAADARTDYERALSIAEDNSVVRLTWRIKYNLGNVYKATGDVATAKKCYLEAIKQIEELRDGHRTPEEKSGFMQHRLRPYQTMIMLAWEEGDMETAKEFVERGMHKSLKVFSNRADGGLDFDAEKEIDKNFFVVNGKGYYVETE